MIPSVVKHIVCHQLYRIQRLEVFCRIAESAYTPVRDSRRKQFPAAESFVQIFEIICKNIEVLFFFFLFIIERHSVESVFVYKSKQIRR